MILLIIKKWEAIAKDRQDKIDVRMVDLKGDEASVEGTQAVRFLVQKLHEAQGNSSLQPVVQALMRASNLATSHNKKKVLSPYRVSLQRNPRVSDRKENSSEGAPQRRRVSRSPIRAAKRHRPSASSDSISSQSGNSERGRHCQRRRRSPSPPSSPPSLTKSKLNANMTSLTKTIKMFMIKQAPPASAGHGPSSTLTIFVAMGHQTRASPIPSLLPLEM